MKFFLVILLTMTSLVSPSTAREMLTPDRPLADDETLVSSGSTFALGFFTPTNSTNRYLGMWFNKAPDRRIVWVANRASPIVNSTGLLSIAPNGTMMITDQKSKRIVWTVGNISGSAVPAAQLLDSGNFVLKRDADNSTSRYAWQSFDHPTDTLLAGMKLGLDWTTGLSVVITAWKSHDDPSEGEYYVEMNTDTDIYLHSSSGTVWRSGPSDGINLRNAGLNYTFVNNSQESTFSFEANDRPTILAASPGGKVQLLAFSLDSQRWDLLWEEPATECDIVGHCGPNGICDIESSTVCSCLQGYVPRNPGKWASADWTDGCVRNTNFDCRNGTDGFVTVARTKLPEFSTPTTRATSLDECRLACLRNCACTAYAIDGGQYGCVIWLTDSLSNAVRINDFQQDLYVRVASSYLVSPVQPRKRKHKKLIILVCLPLGVIILATVACILLRRKTRKRGKMNI
ncbi:receptor-like serine/threonine-protein kinase SD1-8 [Iris pallida]|uniref:Receptor-like serine/threonine-protein kinase SD1-8 n=1 Tax=Iris pallida TaxID=29817 RepID=A0AAX6I108_IRIPA|nr:receptor-like serine/threonine-protein kinase SD1-8 [Iris pallida]